MTTTRKARMHTRSRRVISAALTAATLITLTSCTQDNNPTNTSSTTRTATSATTTTQPGLTDTAAYAQADKNYRAWIKLTDQACNASRGGKAALVEDSEASSVATKSAVSTYNRNNRVFFDVRTPDDTVVRTTCRTTVRSTKGVAIRRQDPVSPWTLSLGVCRETSGRAFNEKGVDIALPQKGVQNGVVLLRSQDKGKTWLVNDNSNLNNPTREQACKY